MAVLRLLLLCAALVVSFTSTVGGASRLVEWEMKLDELITGHHAGSSLDEVPVTPTLVGDVPIISPPNRTAGYFRLDRTVDAYMFYYFFQSRSQNPDDPLVLWTNGGPGCSSAVGVFLENGPYHIEEDMTLSLTTYGWDTIHNIIYIDQPINTGFSYSNSSKDTVHDEAGVAEDVLQFIWEFLAAHPEYQDRDFYVTGESYGGHYVPSIAYRIFQANNKQEGPHINLKGLAVGDGLTDPAIQYGAYGKYALENKLISESVYKKLLTFYPICKKGAETCSDGKSPIICMAALYYCELSQFEPIMTANPGINAYDIRKKCEGSLCYKSIDQLTKFLNQPDIQDKLGVDRKFTECDSTVNKQMMGDWMRNYDTTIPPLLEAGIKVLIYVGDQDLICNWVGNREWVDALVWSGSDNWNGEDDGEWSVDNSPAGMVKSVGPLTFLRVYQAGHMVPMDQPKNGFCMIETFTRGKPWIGDENRPAKEQTEGRSWAEGAAVVVT